jgi:membrane-associated protease RseP (regulator of RpoE activity)
MSLPLVVYVALRATRRRSDAIEATPIYLIFRTQALNRFLVEAPRNHPKITKVISHILLAIYPGLVLLFFVLFGSNLISLIGRSTAASKVSLVIPGLTFGLGDAPYILSAIFVAMVVHELAHAIIGSSRGIPIRSVGIGIFLSLGFALVDFDEEGFKGADRGSKIRAVAAGPAANMILATAIVLFFYIGLAGTAGGIIVLTTSPPASAYIRPWDVIVRINDTAITSDQAFTSYMATIRPGELLVVHTLEGAYSIRAGTNPSNSSRGFLGVSASNYFPRLGLLGAESSYYLIYLMSWMNVVNMSLAILNVAPVAPLDGGKIIDEVLMGKNTSLVGAIKVVISSMTAVILLGNFVLSFYRFGL